MEGARGNRYTYDINGTTNYNQTLGARIGIDGMGEVARYVRWVAAAGRRAATHRVLSSVVLATDASYARAGRKARIDSTFAR